MINQLNAQENTELKPGDASLPSTSEDLLNLYSHEKGIYGYSVEDFFKKPKQYSFQLSPNGQFVSFKKRDFEGKNHVYVKNVTTGKEKRVISEDDQLIAAYGWANNNRLLYLKDSDGKRNYHLFGVDLNGRNPLDLTPFENVRTRFADMLKAKEDEVLIMMNKDNAQVFEPYKLDIKIGEINKLYENTDPENPIVAYDFDNDGKIKAYTQQQNGTDYVLFYRTSEANEFEEVIRTNWKSDFEILGFNFTTENPHDAYVLTNLESNTAEIILYDLKKKMTIEKVYSNKDFDVKGFSRSRKRGYEIDYFYYKGVKDVIIPVSKTYKKLHKKFTNHFSNKQYFIASTTDEEDKYLLYVTSDKLYGTYYVYDVAKDEFKEMMNLRPKLKESDMAEMRSIEFKTRDGLTMYGYLTLPVGAKVGDRAPLIVNPHGGPYGVRDQWGFDSEAQLFASRGYATLQINFRGSGGYGNEFFLAGNKQIGRKMLEDLEDGVEYVKTLNYINEDKIAIYGTSYGGLATLGSLMKTPDLYTCGINNVGISNLFTYFESFPAYYKPYLKQLYEQWYDVNDPMDQELIKEISPAHNADKITKPIFVVQGAKDRKVSIDESDNIVKSLRDRNVGAPYFVKYNEGHGFSREENKIELYKCMLGFFAKHLK